MICVVVLQNDMGYMEGETGSCSETCVTFDFIGTEEVCIKVEEAIDIKEEGNIKVEEAIDIKEEGSIKVEEAIDIKEEGSIKVEEAINIKEEGSIKVEEAINIKEEGSIKVEEAIDVKYEIQDFVSVPSIKTEHEVRFWWCVCEVVAAHAFRPFIAPKRKL